MVSASSMDSAGWVIAQGTASLEKVGLGLVGLDPPGAGGGEDAGRVSRLDRQGHHPGSVRGFETGLVPHQRGAWRPPQPGAA